MAPTLPGHDGDALLLHELDENGIEFVLVLDGEELLEHGGLLLLSHLVQGREQILPAKLNLLALHACKRPFRILHE